MDKLYTILINDNHSFIHTNIKKILRRSKNIDKLQFLVEPLYNDLDMTKVNTILEYVKPISGEYATMTLTPEPELYKNRVQYIVPIDTRLTSEAGELKLTINFSYLSLDEESGEFKEQVRPIGSTAILIEDTPHWSDYIPSADLDNIAQMAMMNQATAEQNRINIELLNEAMVTSLKHNTEDNTLYLINEDGNKVGDTVTLEEIGDCDCEDGVPAVDFTSVEPEENNSVDNVVEF